MVGTWSGSTNVIGGKEWLATCGLPFFRRRCLPSSSLTGTLEEKKMGVASSMVIGGSSKEGSGVRPSSGRNSPLAYVLVLFHQATKSMA